MKKSSLNILTFLLLLVAAVSWSLAQEGPKIGVINSAEVLEKSAEGKKVIARLQERDKANQAALTKLDDEIRQLETKLSTQRLTLTEEALFQMNSDLERKRTERKRVAEDAYRDWNELQVKLYTRVQNELIPIIEQLGKEKGMDIIFDLAKSGAVYYNAAIDLTAEVIKRYDASKATAK